MKRVSDKVEKDVTDLRIWFDECATKSTPDGKPGVPKAAIRRLMQTLPVEMRDHVPNYDTFDVLLEACEDLYTDLNRPATNAPETDLPRSTLRLFSFTQIVMVLWNVLAVKVFGTLRAALGFKIASPDDRKQRRPSKAARINGSYAFYVAGASIIAGALPNQHLVSIDAITAAECTTTIVDTIAMVLAVQLEAELLSDMLAPLFIALEPSTFLAHTIMRSDFAESVIGAELAKQLRSYLHSEAFHLQPLAEDPMSDHRIRTELLEALRDNTRLKHAYACKQVGLVPSVEPERPLLMIPAAVAPTLPHAEQVFMNKTTTLKFALECRLMLKHVPRTLVEAQNVVWKIRLGADLPEQSLFNDFVSRYSLSRHALALDSALDALIADRIRRAIEGGRCFGFSFTSDESPPNCRRYAGLRFQITWLYWLEFERECEWEKEEYLNTRPFKRYKTMCDIMNSTTKTGVGVLQTMATQWLSKGCAAAEVNSGTGDGGGENEGFHGVHSLLTASDATYVARRCIPHYNWTGLKAGEDEMGKHMKDIKALCTYIFDGTTLLILQAIATKPIAEGGLNLMRYGSQQYKDMFEPLPPKMQDMRPELTMLFLKWLNKRERTLCLLVERDLAIRDLKMEQAAIGLATLQDRFAQLLRVVDTVLLHRGLYMFFHTKDKEFIAEHTTLDALLETQLELLRDTRVATDVYEVLGIDMAVVAHESTWMEFGLRQTKGMSDAEFELYFTRIQEYHLRVSNRIAAHLILTMENFSKTTVICSQLLSTDPHTARIGARQLERRLIMEVKPGAGTPFEEHLRNSFMEDISTFAAADPPFRLWGNNCKWATFFKFLACRFLAQPDTVLDCESTHALWKWVETLRRGMKFKMLNAIMKLESWMRCFGDFPSDHEIAPYLAEQVSAMFAQLEALRRTGYIAPGLRNDFMYKARFNLSPNEVDLLKRNLGNKPQPAQTHFGAWAQYVRFLFRKNSFYCFTGLRDGPARNRFVMVVENKSLPGRDQLRDEEASGRKMTVMWFELQDELGDDRVTVCPVEGGSLILSTAAETAKAHVVRKFRY